MNYNECEFITNFRGEFADDYPTHLEYVKSGMWEKDYFANWLLEQTDSDCYPLLEDIERFCHQTLYYLGHWFAGVEEGAINPEGGRIDG